MELNSTILNNPSVKEEILKRENLFNLLKMEIPHIKTSGGAVKAVLTGTFVALTILETERFKIADLSFYLKKLNKEEEIKTRVNRRNKEQK